jgi:glycosyltransferase involved in cell wall biosynthesis
MRKPRFSVVIPTLNEELFLPKLLTSLTKQSNKDFDVVVVDGKSKDKTTAIAEGFRSKLPGLTVAICDTPGVSRQRNMGVRLGRADWLVLVDADSVFLPNFIERISAYIDEKRPRFFTTWFKADVDDPMYAITAFIMNISVELGVLINKPWAPGPLTVVRRDAFESVGGYNEDVTYGEDHELGVMITKKGVPFEIYRELLYIYSFRRFRKEGTLKVLERTIPSTLAVILTNRGITRIPGFISGGSLYWNTPKKKKIRFISKKVEQSIKKFLQDLVE